MLERKTMFDSSAQPVNESGFFLLNRLKNYHCYFLWEEIFVPSPTQDDFQGGIFAVYKQQGFGSN